jgi:1,4-dihydroxy-2-naphthoate octaprenyltransferase
VELFLYWQRQQCFFVEERGQLAVLFIFAVCMLPMIFFFMQWMIKTWKDQAQADFKNSLRMNLLASGCTTICFLILIIMKGFE